MATVDGVKLRPIVLLLSAGTLALPALTHAAPTWIPATMLSAPGRDAQSPSVALSGNGGALVAWQRSDGANTIVQASTRAPGAGWLAPVDLSAAGADAESVRVAAGPDGTLVAAWQRRVGGIWVIEAAVRTASSTSWGAPVTLSTPTSENATRPRVGIADNGDAFVLWQQAAAPNPKIVAAVRSAAGGSWGAAEIVEQAAGTNLPELAVGPGGHVLAVWEATAGANTVICYAVRPPGGPWGAPGLLSPAGTNASQARAAVDADGNAVAVWRLAGASAIVQAGYRPVSGSWSLPADLSASGADAAHPDVAFASDGSAIAVWQRGAAGSAVVQARLRPPTAGWGSTETVTPGGENGAEPELAVDPLGNAVVVYETTSVTPVTTAIVGVRRAVDSGAWSAPAPLPGLDGQPADAAELAIDADGNALAVWEKTDGSNLRVHARALDAAGPSLGSALIPSSAQAGVVASLSVVPSDTLSAISGTASWVFGDGTPAVDGLAVGHAWPAAGLFFVTLSAADAVGNTRILQQLVTVSPAAPAPAVVSPPKLPVAVDPPALVRDISLVRRGASWQLSFELDRPARLDCWLDRMSFVLRRTKLVTSYVPTRRLCPGAAAAGDFAVTVTPRRRGLYRVRILATAEDGSQVLVRRGLRVR